MLLDRLAAPLVLTLLMAFSGPAGAQAPDDLEWWPIDSGDAIDPGELPESVRHALRDADGSPAHTLYPYGQGVITLNRPSDGRVPHDPIGLDAPGIPLIAAAWHGFDGRCGQNNGIWYAVDGAALVVQWRDMTTEGRGCVDWAPKSTFSVRIEAVDGGILRLTFRYSALEVPGIVRAGVVLRGMVNELLPDQSGRPSPGRAAYLVRWGSDGERDSANSIHGFDERGVWIIEIAPDGQALGDPDRDGLRSADNCPDTANSDQDNMRIDGQIVRDDEGDACDLDHDGDRVPNVRDNCVRTPNRDQRDWNRNGVGDVCDRQDGDLDDDGLLDDVDNCPESWNPLQLDLDADGWGDVCDIDPDGDRLLAIDHRGVARDNCPWVYNPVQKDTDRDGLGDTCDRQRQHRPLRGRLQWQSDMDGDDRPDIEDNCPFWPNWDQADADGDRIGDACDPDADGNSTLDIFEGRK